MSYPLGSKQSHGVASSRGKERIKYQSPHSRSVGIDVHENLSSGIAHHIVTG
jgi:hypothetical protein